MTLSAKERLGATRFQRRRWIVAIVLGDVGPYADRSTPRSRAFVAGAVVAGLLVIASTIFVEVTGS